MALVAEKVSARQAEDAGPISRPLVEFYGALGQGKSWLLARLHEEFRRQQQEQAALRRPSFSARVDLGDFPGREHAISLLEALAGQLRGQLERDAPPAVEGSAESRAESLGRWLQQMGSAQVPVVLFDAADRAEERFLQWIEDHLVYHAIRTDVVVFVFASRTRLRWKRFEVRRRVEPHELASFDEAQAGEQVKKLRSEELPDDVAAALWSYSFGHPLTTRVIYENLHPPGDAPLEVKTVEAQKEAVAWAVHAMMEGHLQDRIGWPELRELVWDTCVLRKFNVAHLREFAAGVDRPETFYLDLIRDLVASTLVRWDSEQGGYVLDPVVRRVLARNLQMREPERYVEQHEKAVAMYSRWIGEHPRNAGDYLIELLFHQAELGKAERLAADRIGSKLARVLQRQLDQLVKKPGTQWDLPDVARTLDERLLSGEDVDLNPGRVALGGVQQAAQPFVDQYA